MRITEVLGRERVYIDGTGRATDKASALEALAELLAPSHGLGAEALARQLLERESVQSTGLGEGVAIPHAGLEAVTHQTAALLVVRRGVSFGALDGRPVQVLFGLVGPRNATGEHLRALARISRLLRSADLRRRLIEAETAEEAYASVLADDAGLG